jgi:hypothetical protein
MTESKGNIIIYRTQDGVAKIEARIEGETVWLTQAQMAELFDKAKSTVSEHINNIFEEGELEEVVVVRNFRTTASDGKEYLTKHYNLDAIISVGYRVNSQKATKFRQWATTVLKEYIIKGFALDDERLKDVGGGYYWKELLERIRDIRSSEKVLYRQVLDLYATAVDYDPSSSLSTKFFKIVQNKLHYAAHGNTAPEVVYMRVDSDKPFVGLTNFKGAQPTQAEAMIAKNYLSVDELKILNNLVSAYFDLAEIKAIEQTEMRMEDHIRELDNILKSAGREILDNAGGISHKDAKIKAIAEYRKHKNKTLSDVEKAYLESIKQIEKTVRRKGDYK